MDDSHPDWHLFCNLDACEPAGSGAADAEDRRATRSHLIDALQTSADPANTDPWQPIIGPGSIATGYVALADVAPVPPGVNVSPNVDFDTSSVCGKRFDASPEVGPTPMPDAELPVMSQLTDQPSDSMKSHGCTCPTCAQEKPLVFTSQFKPVCRLPACCVTVDKYRARWYRTNSLALVAHEKTHYEYHGGYKCAEGDCDHLAKQFRDLKRHYRAKHCTKTPDYPCDMLGCKFGGLHGFHRKDKLASHYKNMHQRGAASTTNRRNILPAPAKNEVSGLGIGKSSQ